MATPSPPLYFVLLVTVSVEASALSPASLIGVHPLDEKHFASVTIKCKDGSKSFPRDRLNDNYCDCRDGTDEPGTSACPMGRFYCRNVGSTPQFLFSSQVNDHFCDCCDGSDEYGSSINCPNTCVMGGNVEYKYNSESERSMTSELGGSLNKKETRNKGSLEESYQKGCGLKILIVTQLILTSFMVALWLSRRLAGSRRRHRH